MSFGAIFYTLGWIMSGFGSAMLIPALVSWLYAEGDYASFFYAACGTVFSGVTLVMMNRDTERHLSHRDGFMITLLTWVLLSIIGGLPFYFSGVAATFPDAFFETVSGLTTSGGSVLSGLDNMSHGILLWRGMLNWLGGMGIVVLAIAVLPFLRVGGMQLYESEVSSVVADKLQPRLKETAKVLWIVYLFLTMLCITAFDLGGMSTFDAITHAFASVATGGFSNHDLSFAYFDSAFLDYTACIFMLLGSINHSLHYLAMAGRGWKVYVNDAETRFYLALVAFAIVLIMLILFLTEGHSGPQSLRYSMFNVVSIVTTTGFANYDYEKWPMLAQMVLLTLMFIGGCSGSTSGGLKAMRVMIIIKQGAREIMQLIHPHGVMHVKVNRRTVPDHVMQSVWSFAGLYILSFLLIAMGVSAYGIDLVTSFSATIACMSSIGPGLGEVGPMDNYGWMPGGVKMLLSFAMLLGRLEIFTILVIFAPAFWRR